MSISFGGYNYNSLTFNVNEKIDIGYPVSIYKSFTMKKADDGSAFQGVVVSSDEKYASVQVNGTVTMSYTGAAPSTGYNSLVSNGAGGVKVSSAGRQYLVIGTDETNKTVTFLM